MFWCPREDPRHGAESVGLRDEGLHGTTCTTGKTVMLQA